MTAIRIPPALRVETAGQTQIEVSGTTVRAALEALLSAYPTLEGRVLNRGEVPTYLNLFVDGTDIRILDGLDTPLSPESTLLLLPAMAGG